MVGRIYHVGLTVSDLDHSIAFYRDILGLEFQGEILMEGEETDKMFRKENCKARVAYLNGSKALEAPPVELIQFVDSKIHKEQSDLFTTSISEVSMIPWSTFDGFNLNLQKGYDYLIPIFTMGKYYRDDEKIILPLAIQVHHAVCDGFHICRFVNELQKLINS